MSQPANVLNLRWLVERAVELEAPPSRASLLTASGVPARKSYSLGDGARFPLPTYDGGLQQLISGVAACSPPEGLDPYQAAYGVIGQPTFTTGLIQPSYERLLQLDIPVSPDRLGSVRQLGLASVLKPKIERLSEGYLSSPRIGGLARITTLLSKSGTSADQAWLNMEWATSSATYCKLLESLWGEMNTGTTKSLTKEAALVISEEFESLVSAGMVSGLERIFAVHGLKLVVLRAANMPVSRLRAVLTGSIRSVTVALGIIPALQDLLQPKEGIRRSVLPTVEGAQENLREELCSISKVSAGLLPLGLPDVPVAPRAARIPVTHVGGCLHDEQDRAYVEDLESGLWWTKDTAGHAGTIFKTYKLANQSLHHDACRDHAGVAIGKWKGDQGKVIQLSTLHGCGGKHL